MERRDPSARKATLAEQQAKRRARERMSAIGLRRIAVWGVDTRRSGFDEEAKRQSLRVAESERSDRELDRLMEQQDTTGWRLDD